MASTRISLADAETSRKSTLHIVARNTAFMLAGQVLIKICAFVFSVYVVRRLGADDFGRYSAAMAYGFLFATLTELGMSTLAVREMARKVENIAWMVPDIIVVRLLLSLIVIVGTTLSAWLLGKTLDMVIAVLLASCGLLIYALHGPLDSIMIARERLDLSSAFNVLNQIVFVAIGTIVLLTGGGYIGLLVASLIGILAMTMASGYAAIQILGIRLLRPDPRRWLKLLRASSPFGAIGIISEFTRSFNVVYISFALTYAAVSWYTIPYNLILMMLLLAQSLALSIYPSMVVEYDSGRGSIQNTVQRAMRYLLLLSLPLAIGGMLAADRIIVS